MDDILEALGAEVAPFPLKVECCGASYGVAKKALLVMAQAYRSEFGSNFVVLFPVNLYGPRDNFDLETSHVIPALIRKVEDAVRRMLAQEDLARFVYSLPVRHSALLRPEIRTTPPVFVEVTHLLEQGVHRGEVRDDIPVDLLARRVHPRAQHGTGRRVVAPAPAAVVDVRHARGVLLEPPDLHGRVF